MMVCILFVHSFSAVSGRFLVSVQRQKPNNCQRGVPELEPEPAQSSQSKNDTYWCETSFWFPSFAQPAVQQRQQQRRVEANGASTADGGSLALSTMAQFAARRTDDASFLVRPSRATPCRDIPDTRQVRTRSTQLVSTCRPEAEPVHELVRAKAPKR